MNIFVHGNKMDRIVQESIFLIHKKGHNIAPSLQFADLAVAPLLNRKLADRELDLPRMGTLIFHPSLLPVHRGRDAIKWAFHMGEWYTGATWFWADEGYDTGDICEQEVLRIEEGERPRSFYERAVVPAGLRMLGLILDDLEKGVVRRRPQQEEHASYEAPLPKKGVPHG